MHSLKQRGLWWYYYYCHNVSLGKMHAFYNLKAFFIIHCHKQFIANGTTP